MSLPEGQQANKFEQFSSVDHQMSIAEDQRGLISDVGDDCTVTSNASWVMVTWGTQLNT